MIERPIVFVIDDDEDDRFNFANALKEVDEDASLIFAEDGVHALSLIDTPDFAYPQLIFLDLNMPRMNGVELLSKLRQDAKFSEVPIIMYSTSLDHQTKQDCMQLGAADYLQKPYSFNALIEQLQFVMSRYKMPAA